MRKKQEQQTTLFDVHYSKLSKPDFEKSILGGIILENSGLEKVKDIIAASDFASIANQVVYSCICKIIADGRPVDFLILKEELEKTNELDTVGGVAYISTLIDDYPSTLNIVQHAKTILDYSIKRQFFKFHYKSADLLPKADNLTEYLQNQRTTFDQIIEKAKYSNGNENSFIEFAPDFLSGEDEPAEYLIPELIPKHATVTFHGSPRALKTYAADEVVVSVITKTPAFGLERFMPERDCRVWRLTQEDPRGEERRRFKALLKARNVKEWPSNLAFSVHKGINFDEKSWQIKIIAAIKKHQFDLVVIDPIRRFSEKTDKGPSDVRTLTQFLRHIVEETGCTIIIIHHDVKESAQGEDSRRRGHKISGGDWFAFTDCPVHFQKISDSKSLAVPEDYKFSTDPEPFTFELYSDDSKNPKIIRLTGKAEKSSDAKTLELRAKITEFLKHSPGKSGSAIAKGIRKNKQSVLDELEVMLSNNEVDSAPGKRRSVLWFLREAVAV